MRVSVLFGLFVTMLLMVGCGGGGGGGAVAIPTTEIPLPAASVLPSFVTTFQNMNLVHGLETSVAVYGHPTPTTHNVRVDTTAVTGANAYRFWVRTSGSADQTINTNATFVDLILPDRARSVLTITALNGAATILTKREIAIWPDGDFPVVGLAKWKVLQNTAAHIRAPIWSSGMVGNMGWWTTTSSTAGCEMTTVAVDANGLQTYAVFTGMNNTDSTGTDFNGSIDRNLIGFFDRYVAGPSGTNLYGDLLDVWVNWTTPLWRATTGGARNGVVRMQGGVVSAPTS